MVVILKSPDQLKSVLKELPQYYPKSYAMETMLRNSLAKKCEWPGMEFVVDKYPEWNVCLTRPIKDSPNYVNRETKYAVSLFAKDNSALEKFLDEPDVVDWTQPVQFHALPRPDVYDIVRRKCLSVNPKLRHDGNGNYHVFQLQPNQIKSLPCPPGLHLGELREAQHADLVLQHWPFGHEEARDYIHFLLAKDTDFPNAAIFDMDTGLPVAYILYMCDGAMGMGWVSETYRHKGLFQVVNYELAKKLFAIGHPVVWAYVRDDNEGSVRSYEHMGGEKCEYRVDWVTSSANGNNEEKEDVRQQNNSNVIAGISAGGDGSAPITYPLNEQNKNV